MLLKIKKIKIILFFTCLISVIYTPLFAETVSSQSPNQFLSVTDIHFNPFSTCDKSVTSCAAVKELQNAPTNLWAEILTQHETTSSQYGTDTNYILLKSSLLELNKKAMDSKIHFVVILGDYLSHDYRKNYALYSGDTTQEGYQAFVKKTMEFLTAELARTFAHSDVYMTLGNNDSYNDDYDSEPNGAFYSDMSNLWSSLIKTKTNQEAMAATFPTAGYYAVDLPHHANLRLIVLNSNLFSMKAVGNHVDEAAHQELNWLQDQLASLAENNRKAIIAFHIPPGIDTYATQKNTPLQIVELWKPSYTARFQKILSTNSDTISIVLAGHFHMDLFQILCPSCSHPIALSITPAISPGFGNHPGFKVFSYAIGSGDIKNYTTYIFGLGETTPKWHKEYDFNTIYKNEIDSSDHKPWRIVDGMLQLKPSGTLADHYRYFFAEGTQPIMSDNKWMPYYWCAVRTLLASDYETCLNKPE